MLWFFPCFQNVPTCKRNDKVRIQHSLALQEHKPIGIHKPPCCCCLHLQPCTRKDFETLYEEKNPQFFCETQRKNNEDESPISRHFYRHGCVLHKINTKKPIFWSADQLRYDSYILKKNQVLYIYLDGIGLGKGVGVAALDHNTDQSAERVGDGVGQRRQRGEAELERHGRHVGARGGKLVSHVGVGKIEDGGVEHRAVVVHAVDHQTVGERADVQLLQQGRFGAAHLYEEGNGTLKGQSVQHASGITCSLLHCIIFIPEVFLHPRLCLVTTD